MKTRRKHEVALAARCGLACARCLQDDLTITIHYIPTHMTPYKYHYIQYRIVSETQLGGAALVRNWSFGAFKAVFSLFAFLFQKQSIANRFLTL